MFDHRDVEKAKRAALEFKEQTGQDIIIEPLDLADVESVKQFAERCLQESRLDILVNNAGVMMPVRGLKTKQNFEVSFLKRLIWPKPYYVISVYIYQLGPDLQYKTQTSDKKRTLNFL